LEGFEDIPIEEKGILIYLKPEHFGRSDEIIEAARDLLGVRQFFNHFP
jgi:hypothetical protein